MVEDIYNALLDHYGDPHWWPARTPYEVIVGAILTQNTAWTSVEKAIANFGECPTPSMINDLPEDQLMEIIRPAGYARSKAQYLKNVTAWYGAYEYSVEAVRQRNLTDVRNELLSVKGVGPETADSILLYAFGLPTFVVDAYTYRLCERIPLPVRRIYGEVQAYFTNGLIEDAGIYNRYHALIVVNAKEHCKKRPVCEGCPIRGLCQVGGSL